MPAFIDCFAGAIHTQGQASIAARGGHTVFVYPDNGPLPEVAITYDTDGYNKVTWPAHLSGLWQQPEQIVCVVTPCSFKTDMLLSDYVVHFLRAEQCKGQAVCGIPTEWHSQQQQQSHAEVG